MRFDRRAGVFLHVTSLPGDGIGTLGEPAYDFLDWLDRAGVSLWQVCPLGPTTGIHGNSPYQSFSAFAGNPLLIDLDELVAEDWLPATAVGGLDADPHHVDFEAVRAYKRPLLRQAFERFETAATEADREAFTAFRERAADWLDDYTLFVALKGEFEGRPWTEWPDDLRDRDPEALAAARERLADEVRYREFEQFCFDRQWRAVHDAASERGIDMVGDVPIYVGLDSADVWANPEAFQLDAEGRPTAVAGVPPDMGDSGQRWGNPLYDWDHLRETGFEWWGRRFERLLDLVDVTRIDHFKGFESYWAIPVDADDPAEGEWHDAPGGELFETLETRLGGLPAIAEDIGHLTPELHALREEFDLPGMRVVQFADWCSEEHLYLPHTYPENSVAYTGTHDTDTVVGWYRSLDDEQRSCLHYYLDTDGHEIQWDLLDATWGSAAVLAIAPLADVLGLGSDARFNTPGTATGNWDWRVTEAGLDDGVADRLRELTAHHDRG